MNLNELIQTISALTSIAMILIGSQWLKHYLRAIII